MGLDRIVIPGGKKVLAAVGLAFTLSTSGLIMLGYNHMEKEVNNLFIESGGNTNTASSMHDKAEFIKAQPGYHSKRSVEYYHNNRSESK